MATDLRAASIRHPTVGWRATDVAPIWHPSPNFGQRTGEALPDLVVLHYTAMETAEAALSTLCNPDTEVSAHYLIAEDGRVFHLVEEKMRAWHAGAGAWGSVTDVNSRSIGIELANTGFAPFSSALMDGLEPLLARILRDWAIPPERVIAHSDMAPGRKIDPGKRFDWQRLARAGLAVWPEPTKDAAPDEAQFLRALEGFGYPSGAAPETLLEAFRSRFNRTGAGALSGQDMARALDLARRFPVDRQALTS